MMMMTTELIMKFLAASGRQKARRSAQLAPAP
jgi:hypothetical protein